MGANTVSGLGGDARSTPLADAARGWLLTDRGLLIVLSAFTCVIHFLCNWRYGYFRDELYFAACGEHLDWGFVDQAPLIALVARISRALLGDSLSALRFFPAIASGATVWVGGAIARELGGRRFAQVLAAVSVLAAPIYLTFGNLLTMNAFEPLLWGLCALVAIRAMRLNRPRLWILFGVIAGIGIENKHSMLFFGSGIFLGLVLTESRAALRSLWIWLGGVAAFLLFLPNLLWQAAHGWPTLEFLKYRQPAENIPTSAIAFIAQQGLLCGPVAAPVAIAGLAYLFLGSAARPYRLLGWAYLTVLTELILLGGKIYYLSPFDVILFGAGAVWIESAVARVGREWLKPAIVAPIAAAGLVAAPLAMPVLPVAAASRYARFFGVEKVRVEMQPESDLPQLFADMFGWENQVATAAAVFQGLSPEEQKHATILVGAFGEAAAVDYFGGRIGLPKAVCAENAYYLWGPRDAANDVVISYGITLDKLGQVFADIQTAAIINSPYAMPDETNIPVYICRKPRMSLHAAWPILRSVG